MSWTLQLSSAVSCRTASTGLYSWRGRRCRKKELNILAPGPDGEGSVYVFNCVYVNRPSLDLHRGPFNHIQLPPFKSLEPTATRIETYNLFII